MEDQNCVNRVSALFENTENNMSKQQEAVYKKVYRLLPTEKHREIYQQIRHMTFNALDATNALSKSKKEQYHDEIEEDAKEKKSEQNAITNAAKTRFTTIDKIGDATKYSNLCYSDFDLLKEIPCPTGWHQDMTHDEYLLVLKQREYFQREMIVFSKQLLQVINQE